MENLMRTRFQVEVQSTSCMTTEEQRSYRAGYNSVVVAYIDRTFGDNSYDKAIVEVEQFRMNTYEASQKSKKP